MIIVNFNEVSIKENRKGLKVWMLLDLEQRISVALSKKVAKGMYDQS